MYFQFLIEDRSTEILVKHIMEKLKEQYENHEIIYDCKSFKGIGHLKKGGSILEQKTGNLLNDLRMYLKGFDVSLINMDQAAIVVVLDNDKRDVATFQNELEQIAVESMILTDHVFCIAVKEMESWLLGDINAVEEAYPKARKSAIKGYTQDGICDTWEVLANMVYPGGLSALYKKAGSAYSEIGKAKSAWADSIGQRMNIEKNKSPSFRHFIMEIKNRIDVL